MDVLRCGECGTGIEVEAQPCPSCGADPSTGPLILDADASRRQDISGFRQLGRWSMAAALVVLLIGALVIDLGRRPPFGRTAFMLVEGGSLVAVQNDGRSRRQTLPGPPTADLTDGQLQTVGRSVILVRHHHAWLVSRTLSRPAGDLGPATGVLPSPRSDVAWIVNIRDGYLADSYTMRALNLTTHRVTTPVGLPVGFPVASNRYGIVIEAPVTGGLVRSAQIWDPFRRTTVFRITPAQPFGNFEGDVLLPVLAADRDVVVWQEPCLRTGPGGCELHIADLRTNARRTVAIPNVAFDGQAGFSADGRTLALGVHGVSDQANGGEVSADVVPSRWGVVVVDVRSGRLHLVDTRRLQTFYPYWGLLAWSGTGRRLYYLGKGGPHVWAYQSGRSPSVVSGVRLPSPLDAQPAPTSFVAP